jgi:nucleoside-diphosphate-sugar epimerase
MDAKKDIVLITGASGHIAGALIQRLAASCDIVGMDAAGSPPEPAHCIALDLESEDSVKAGLEQLRQTFGSRIAAVVHLAAYFGFDGEPNAKYYTVNVLGTLRLLQALQAFEVERFIYSSTMLVHAPQSPGHRIQEDSPLEPKWAYPRSKVEAEQIIREQHGHIPFAILRIAGVYDEQCRLPALAQQIQRIAERRLIGRVFPGNSSHGQAAVHLDDLVDAVARLIQKRAALPEGLTLLIGEPDTPSYEAIQQELGRLIHGEPWETRAIPKALAKSGAWLEEVVLPKEEEPFIKPWMIDLADDHYELDISRAGTLLGWHPQHRLLSDLPDMVYAMRQDPAAWYQINQLAAPDDLQEKMPQQKAPSCDTARPRA